MKKKKQIELYYVLRKLNPESKYDFNKYIYIHDRLGVSDAEWKIGSAILFNSKEEAEQYRVAHIEANEYEVYEIDPRKQCLSTSSCDDCSWGGTCPRFPKIVTI